MLVFHIYIQCMLYLSIVSHSYRIIILTVPIVIVSIGFGIMCSFFTALITTVTGQTMTYFAHPLLIVPLFYIPTLLGMTWVHYWWRNKVMYMYICKY